MVVVFALGFQVQSDRHGIGERAEEVFHHLGAQIANALIGKVGFVFEVRTAGDIQRAAGRAFVHRQHKAETADTAFVAEGQLQRFAQRKPGIFHGVVIVDIKIAADVNLRAEAAVGGDLVKHMIEEADAGGDFAAAFAVQPHFHIHRVSLVMRSTWA